MARTYGVEAGPEQVLAFLTHIISTNMSNVKKGKPKHAVCVWGPKGIGKTALVEQLPEHGVVKHVEVIPIAEIEEMGDIIGLPLMHDTDGRTVTVMAPPQWVPTTNEPSILAIDDFNRADMRIVRGTMQLVQKHKTISWTLPDNCTIILTANPEEDEYSVTQLDPAMLTRMHHITMKTEFRAWLKWAAANDIDGRVMSFIARYHEILMPPDARRTCPRSWAMFASAIAPIQEIKGQTTLVKMFGNSVLDEESVNGFITFAEGILEWVVEPERIAKEYAQVRDTVLKSITEGRQDMFNVMMERLVAWIEAQGEVKMDGPIQKNVIALLEEDLVPKEMKHLYTRLLGKGPMKNQLISGKLAIQLGRVVGDRVKE